MARLRPLVGYFRKYGDQYDVDWVLMGAQGYQESQLNQDAKSNVGAIGVMQLTGYWPRRDQAPSECPHGEPRGNRGSMPSARAA